MDATDLARRSDQNYIAAYSMLAEVNGFPVADYDGATCLPTGVPDASLNQAIIGQPLKDPERSLRQVIEFFEELGLPFVLRIREGAAPEAEEAAELLGLPYSDTEPGLALAPIPEIPQPPAGFEIRPVRDPAELSRFHHVAASGFGIPVEGAQMLMREPTLALPAMESYVGYADGLPVATSTLVVSGGTAGVYVVSTLASHRGRGFGEAMTWRAIAGGLAAGCDAAILQASEMGRPIYERMGFRLVAPYRTFHRPE